MTHRIRVALTLLTLLAAAPKPAFADGLFTPWLGVNFAHEPADGRTSFGFTGTAMSGGVLGAEFDFGYSPSFFGEENVFGTNNVLTAVGNLVVGIPLGGTSGVGVRPYGTAGVGLIRSRIDQLAIDFTSNDFGINAGGGVYVFFSDRIGLRGDLRYFRAGFDDLDIFNIDEVNFWRASIGLTIR
jgi:opacity protein-like surface antigen